MPRTEEFAQFLTGKGLRLTGPREAIVEALSKLPHHFTADEMAKTASVGRVTVYRTLALLVDAGILAQRNFLPGRTHYELDAGKDHHEHMICESCGSITEFQNEPIEELQDEIVEKHGYELSYHFLRIYGRCSACAKKSR